LWSGLPGVTKGDCRGAAECCPDAAGGCRGLPDEYHSAMICYKTAECLQASTEFNDHRRRSAAIAGCRQAQTGRCWLSAGRERM